MSDQVVPVVKMESAQGWECPRCHAINAPWRGQCGCKPTQDATKLPKTTPWTTPLTSPYHGSPYEQWWNGLVWTNETDKI
jgi:hypothetical protein